MGSKYGCTDGKFDARSETAAPTDRSCPDGQEDGDAPVRFPGLPFFFNIPVLDKPLYSIQGPSFAVPVLYALGSSEVSRECRQKGRVRRTLLGAIL